VGRQPPEVVRLVGGWPPDFATLARHTLKNPCVNGEMIRLDGVVRVQLR
jgi:hypothetical protein